MSLITIDTNKMLLKMLEQGYTPEQADDVLTLVNEESELANQAEIAW